MGHLLIFNIGGSEFLLIGFVVLLFFGAKGVPDIARSLGRATREFKDAMSGIEQELKDATNPDIQAPAPKPADAKKEEVKPAESEKAGS